VKTLTNHELRELLSKNWMTHDGMWFRHVLETVGIEQTNRINRAAIRALAPIEAKRMLKALGLKRPRNFAEVKAMIDGFFGLQGADFMHVRYDFPAENVIRFPREEGECFAREGMKRLGVADEYECGLYERICAWLNAMDLTYTLHPDDLRCLIPTQGRCVREIHFSF